MSQVHLVCRSFTLGPLLWSPQPRTQSVWSCALIFDPIMPHTQQLLFSPPKLNTSQGGRWKMSGLGWWWHMHRAEQREKIARLALVHPAWERHIEGWSPCIRTGRVLGTQRDAGGGGGEGVAFIGVQALLSSQPRKHPVTAFQRPPPILSTSEQVVTPPCAGL